MPKLPDYTALGKDVQPTPSSHVPSYSPTGFNYTGPRAGEYFGRALKDIGGELQQFGAREQNKADALQHAQADADFQIGYAKTVSELQRDPDYESAPDKYNERMRAVVEGAAGNIQDKTKQQLFLERHLPAVERGHLHFEEQRFKRQGEAVVGDINTKAEQLYKDGLASGDPQLSNDNIKAVRDLYAGAVASGHMTPKQADAATRKFAERYGEDWLKSQPEEKRLEILRTLLPNAPQRAGNISRDISQKENLRIGGEMQPVGLVVHHTGGGGNAEDVAQTLRERGLSVQFVVERDGKIVQLTPDGRVAYHAGKTEKSHAIAGRELGNSNMEGVEVIARDEKDVTPAQRIAVAQLADMRSQKYGWDIKTGVYGHGELTGRKEADEGSTARMIREARLTINPVDRGGVTATDADSRPRDTGQTIANPTLQPVQRSYGDTKFPIQIPGIGVGTARDQVKASGIYDQLPDKLRAKIEGAGLMSGLSLDKGDLDSIPDDAWRKIAPRFGLPAPAEKKAEQQAQATPPAREVVRTGTPADFIPGHRLPALHRGAERDVAVSNNRKDSEFKAQDYRLKKELDDNVARVSAGDHSGDNAIDRETVRTRLGAKALQEYDDRVEMAHEVFKQSSDLATMPNHDIENRVAALTPDPTRPNFKQQADVQAAVKKRGEAIMRLRESDPATSVEADPAVKRATLAAQGEPGSPNRQRDLYDARIAAQERAGIEHPSPITRAEAQDLARPLDRILPGQEREALNKMGQAAKEKYGDYADEAFAYAIRTKRLTADASRVAARVLRSLGNDETPSREDAQAADGVKEIDAARKAIAGVPRPSMSSGGFSDYRMPAAPAAPEIKMAPAKAMQALRADPSLADQFDAKYGKGAAKRVLELGAGPQQPTGSGW